MSDIPSDGLAGMPPGPEPAMRLALLDPHEVPDERLLELLRAEWRQLAHQQARVWQVLAEMARRDPFPNLPERARWSATQIVENAVDENPRRADVDPPLGRQRGHQRLSRPRPAPGDASAVRGTH